MMLVSCSKFLEEKPDQKMVIPKTLKDAELLLNDYSNFNTGYPVSGEWGTDDYFIAGSYWDELSNPEQKSAYVWADKQYDDVTQWQSPYRVVYLANQVLAMLSDLQELQHEDQYKKVLGTAYFFRAFAFHQVTEVFAPAYSVSTAGTALGIPLRLSADMDITSVRASLAETYSGKGWLSGKKNSFTATLFPTGKEKDILFNVSGQWTKSFEIYSGAAKHNSKTTLIDSWDPEMTSGRWSGWSVF